ncbi:MAG TPA: hypothetical protein VGK47_06275 [Nitrososphaeraceae archaeon]
MLGSKGLAINFLLSFFLASSREKFLLNRSIESKKEEKKKTRQMATKSKSSL